jgi:adenylate cyclase
MSDFSSNTTPKNSEMDPASRPMRRLSIRAMQHIKRLILAVTIIASAGSVLAGLAGYWNFYLNASDLMKNPPASSDSKAGASKKIPWLSVAVAPFNDMGASKDTLAASLTETLITELSRFPGFIVRKISLEDQATASSDPEHKLGVRYLLHGSVERSGNLVRVDAQLVDLKTSANIWTDKIEGSGGNQFELQDFVAARLANVMNLEMGKAASTRLISEHMSNLDAEDYALMGRNILRTKLRTRDSLQEAESLLEKSLQIKPDNLDALVGLSIALCFETASFPGPDTQAQAARADALADRAIQIAPASADAHVAKSLTLIYYNKISESNDQAELATKINPSLSQAYVLIASDEFREGKFQEAIDSGKYALRINPIDQQLIQGFMTVGNSYIGLKDYDNAVLWLQRMVAANAAMWRGHAGLASAYALRNQMQLASLSIAEAQRLNPMFSVSSYRNSLHMDMDGPANAEFMDRMSRALRAAGAPETTPRE